jgi:enoyl-CoA hydratase
MELKNLIYTIENKIGFITINRPNFLNALNEETLKELEVLLDKIVSDESDVIIITGAGDKAFVAGADINELNKQDGSTGENFALLGQSVFNKIENLGKLVIAAVNGYALGGGCELAMACHIRYASENAKFGQPEIKLGIIPGYGGTQRFPRYIGVSQAIEYSLTGDLIGAEKALNLGLVNKVLSGENLLEECTKLAQKISSMGQIAVKNIISTILATREKPLSDGLRFEANLFGSTCGTEDFKEGTNAFLQKRAPHFSNK